jgi:hypothetical protein
MGEKLKRFRAMVSSDELQRFDAAADAADTEINQQWRKGDSGSCEAAKDEVGRARNVRAEYRLEEAWTVLNAAKRRTLRSRGWSELV